MSSFQVHATELPIGCFCTIEAFACCTSVLNPVSALFLEVLRDVQCGALLARTVQILSSLFRGSLGIPIGSIDFTCGCGSIWAYWACKCQCFHGESSSALFSEPFLGALVWGAPPADRNGAFCIARLGLCCFDDTWSGSPFLQWTYSLTSKVPKRRIGGSGLSALVVQGVGFPSFKFILETCVCHPRYSCFPHRPYGRALEVSSTSLGLARPLGGAWKGFNCALFEQCSRPLWSDSTLSSGLGFSCWGCLVTGFAPFASTFYAWLPSPSPDCFLSRWS